MLMVYHTFKTMGTMVWQGSLSTIKPSSLAMSLHVGHRVGGGC